MKSILILLLTSLLLISCSKNDDGRIGNPNIPNYAFDTGTLINTNLPQFSNLQFPGNFIELSQYGVNGVVLYSSGTTYSAFELSDPNHQINTCSRLSLEGIIASCTCDDGNSYNIVNGGQQEGTAGQYGLVPYGVEILGNIIRVFNN